MGIVDVAIDRAINRVSGGAINKAVVPVVTECRT